MRKRGAPSQERAVCPKCSRKKLGNTYFARFVDREPFAYRQCASCGHTAKQSGVAVPPLEAKADFPRNKRERAVFDNYVNGCTGGALFAFVERGRDGEPAPPRDASVQYAAWMAGRELAATPNPYATDKGD